jgi:hypothetical protein
MPVTLLGQLLSAAVADNLHDPAFRQFRLRVEQRGVAASLSHRPLLECLAFSAVFDPSPAASANVRCL